MTNFEAIKTKNIDELAEVIANLTVTRFCTTMHEVYHVDCHFSSCEECYKRFLEAEVESKDSEETDTPKVFGAEEIPKVSVEEKLSETSVEISKETATSIEYSEKTTVNTNSTFKLSDLKDGYFVIDNQSRKGVVNCDATVISWLAGGYTKLDLYNEDLTCNPRALTISRVFKNVPNLDLIVGLNPMGERILAKDLPSSSPSYFEGLELYNRTEDTVAPTKMTLEEICKALGKQIEIVDSYN